MKKLEIIKTAISFGVSIGIGAIVGNAVKSTTPSDIGKISKLLVGMGSLTLTGIVGDMAGKYAEEKIDEVLDKMKSLSEEEKDNEL